jgi:hypothetical protein
MQLLMTQHRATLNITNKLSYIISKKIAKKHELLASFQSVCRHSDY